jgi:predicted RNase H-like HicB family nuclease
MVAVVALIHGKKGAYGISYPDFPGCISGGKTADEALQRGREGLAFHIESMAAQGLPLPRIRSIAEIEADPEHAADLRSAMLALVDVDMPGRAARLNISMDEKLIARIDRAAKATGESRSGFLAAAARKRLAEMT